MTDKTDTHDIDRWTDALIDADASLTDASGMRDPGIGKSTQLVAWLSVLRAQGGDEAVLQWIDPAGEEIDLPDDLSGLNLLDVALDDEEPPAGGDR